MFCLRLGSCACKNSLRHPLQQQREQVVAYSKHENTPCTPRNASKHASAHLRTRSVQTCIHSCVTSIHIVFIGMGWVCRGLRAPHPRCRASCCSVQQVVTGSTHGLCTVYAGLCTVLHANARFKHGACTASHAYLVHLRTRTHPQTTQTHPLHTSVHTKTRLCTPLTSSEHAKTRECTHVHTLCFTCASCVCTSHRALHVPSEPLRAESALKSHWTP